MSETISLILGLGGLGMMGVGVYKGVTNKDKKKPLPWILIAAGLVSVVLSFVVLMVASRAPPVPRAPPAPPAPQVVTGIPKINAAINNPNNMGRMTLGQVGGGRPQLVINPA